MWKITYFFRAVMICRYIKTKVIETLFLLLEIGETAVNIWYMHVQKLESIPLSLFSLLTSLETAFYEKLSFVLLLQLFVPRNIFEIISSRRLRRKFFELFPVSLFIE